MRAGKSGLGYEVEKKMEDVRGIIIILLTFNTLLVVFSCFVLILPHYPDNTLTFPIEWLPTIPSFHSNQTNVLRPYWSLHPITYYVVYQCLYKESVVWFDVLICFNFIACCCFRIT